jgi:hypothetical protein
MTPLRQKMIRAMELRNLAQNTQRYYLSAVIGLTQHYRQSPDKLTKEMIEDYIHFNLRTSLIFRMDNLLPAMGPPP